MNLKKKFFGIIAASAIGLSLVLPVAGAEVNGTGNVNVTNGGSFNAYFCRTLDFGSVSLNSYQDAEKNAALEICYNDTQSYRDGFKINVSASDFELQGANPWNVGTPVIPASNFKLGTIYNPHQGQWDSSAGVDVGDIGGWAGSNGAVTTHPNPKQYGGLSSLETARPVAYSWNGSGTANGTNMPIAPIPNVSTGTGYVNGTYQAIGVDLKVPAGLPGGTYQSTLTMTIIPGQGTP